MKFAVFCPAVLFALSAIIDSQPLVQAVKIDSKDNNAMLQDSDVTMPSAADMLSLAQWGAASPFDDLTEGDQEHQFYLGQLSSDYTQDFDMDMDHLEFAQAKVDAEKVTQV